MINPVKGHGEVQEDHHCAILIFQARWDISCKLWNSINSRVLRAKAILAMIQNTIWVRETVLPLWPPTRSFWPPTRSFWPQLDHFDPQLDHFDPQLDHFDPQLDHFDPQLDDQSSCMSTSWLKCALWGTLPSYALWSCGRGSASLLNKWFSCTQSCSLPPCPDICYTYMIYTNIYIITFALALIMCCKCIYNFYAYMQVCMGSCTIHMI